MIMLRVLLDAVVALHVDTLEVSTSRTVKDHSMVVDLFLRSSIPKNGYRGPLSARPSSWTSSLEICCDCELVAEAFRSLSDLYPS